MAKLVALRAMKIDDADPELHHTVGLLLQQEGDADGALLEFKRALEVRDDYLPAHVLLAQMALQSAKVSPSRSWSNTAEATPLVLATPCVSQAPPPW